MISFGAVCTAYGSFICRRHARGAGGTAGGGRGVAIVTRITQGAVDGSRLAVVGEEVILN